MRFSGEPRGPDQARRAGNNSLEKHEPCQTESAENVFLEKVAILLDKTGTEGFSWAAGRYGEGNLPDCRARTSRKYPLKFE